MTARTFPTAASFDLSSLLNDQRRICASGLDGRRLASCASWRIFSLRLFFRAPNIQFNVWKTAET
jgi:hypothetical protein